MLCPAPRPRSVERPASPRARVRAPICACVGPPTGAGCVFRIILMQRLSRLIAYRKLERKCASSSHYEQLEQKATTVMGRIPSLPCPAIGSLTFAPVFFRFGHRENSRGATRRSLGRCGPSCGVLTKVFPIVPVATNAREEVSVVASTLCELKFTIGHVAVRPRARCGKDASPLSALFRSVGASAQCLATTVAMMRGRALVISR